MGDDFLYKVTKSKKLEFLYSYEFKLLFGLFFLIVFSVSSPVGRSSAFDGLEIQYLVSLKNYAGNLSLQFPIDVYACVNGDICILDSGLSKILIFNKDLLPSGLIEKANGLDHPVAMAADKEGMIYVSEETSGGDQKGQIKIFDTLGRTRGTIRYEGFPGAESFIARDMTVDQEGLLYLAGGPCGKLLILSKHGSFIKLIELKDKDEDGRGKKSDVARVALKENLIYLLSEWRGHVYVYNRNGERLKTFGSKGGGPGKLSRAQGLTVDPKGGLTFVMDYMRHTLLAFDPTGDLIREFGGKGVGPGWFNFPKDICIDGQGRLFIADTFNKRVQVLQTGSSLHRNLDS